MTYKVLMGTLNPTHLFTHSLETFFGKSYSPLGHELQHLVTLRANLAAQCIVIGPVCLCVCLFVCGSVTTITTKLCASTFTILGL